MSFVDGADKASGRGGLTGGFIANLHGGGAGGGFVVIEDTNGGGFVVNEDTNGGFVNGSASNLAIVLLVLVLLVLGAAGTAVAADACYPCSVAEQISMFCPSGESYSERICCNAVTYVMNSGFNSEPPCLCRLEECIEFLFMGCSFEDLFGVYIACGGERPADAQELVKACDDGDYSDGRRQPATLTGGAP